MIMPMLNSKLRTIVRPLCASVPSTQRGISTTAIVASRSNNPFRILGIPLNSSVKTAQKAFLKLALQHHPDTSSNMTNERGDVNRKNNDVSALEFVRIRQAFERIRDGRSKNNHEEEENDDDGHPAASWTEADFLNWFFEQTGMRLSSDQRRELVQLHRSRVPGGRYDGPSWELARRLVAEQDAFLRQRQQQQQQRGHSFSSQSASSDSRKQQQQPSTDNPMRRKRRR